MRAIIERAVASAAAARSDLDPELLALLGRILRLEVEEPAADELAMRFQQLTPAAMAKGVEDTAFYRHHRLVALNEVGGDPGRFGTSVAAVHREAGGGGCRFAGGHAVAVDPRHQAQRRRPRPAGAAVGGPGRMAGSGRAPGPGFRASSCRCRPAHGRGRLSLLPDPDRRLADRRRPGRRVSAEGEPRGEAAHVVDRAGRGLRSRARSVRARVNGRLRLPRGR